VDSIRGSFRLGFTPEKKKSGRTPPLGWLIQGNFFFGRRFFHGAISKASFEGGRGAVFASQGAGRGGPTAFYIAYGGPGLSFFSVQAPDVG